MRFARGVRRRDAKRIVGAVRRVERRGERIIAPEPVGDFEGKARVVARQGGAMLLDERLRYGSSAVRAALERRRFAHTHERADAIAEPFGVIGDIPTLVPHLLRQTIAVVVVAGADLVNEVAVRVTREALE